MAPQPYWFKAKRVGWGLSPAGASGWVATVVFVIVDSGGTFALMPFFGHTHPEVLTAWAVFWFIAFIALILVKAEPGWWKRWGDGA